MKPSTSSLPIGNPNDIVREPHRQDRAAQCRLDDPSRAHEDGMVVRVRENEVENLHAHLDKRMRKAKVDGGKEARAGILILHQQIEAFHHDSAESITQQRVLRVHQVHELEVGGAKTASLEFQAPDFHPRDVCRRTASR